MRALLVLALMALAGALIPSPVLADADGVVEGSVRNGSEGGGPVGGVEVTLRIESPTAGEVSTRTNASGRFRFEGLSTADDYVYSLSVRYQGVEYTVGVPTEAPGSLRRVDVRVYETTTSAEAVTVLLDHQMAKARPDERCLEVVNYIVVANAGDRTVVARRTGEAPWRLPPVGAESVQFLGSLSGTGAVSEGLVSGYGAIPPGEHELILTYELPYEDGSVDVRKPLAFRTEKAVFLMSAGDGTAESAQLPAVKEADTAAGAQHILTGEQLPAGTVLEVTVSGLPAGGGASFQSVLAPAAVIFAIMAAGTAVAYVRIRGRRVSAPRGER